MKLTKRTIFIIACIVVIIAIAVVIIIANSGKKTAIEGENLPVEAYYQQSGKDIKVVLKKTSDKAYYWTCEPEKTGYVNVKDNSGARKNVYVISADTESNVISIDFDLASKENANVVKYTITLTFDMNENGKLSVVDTCCQEFEEALTGEISGVKYTIVAEDDGYSVYVEDTEKNWGIKASSSRLFADGPISEEGKNKFIIGYITDNEAHANEAVASESEETETTEETAETDDSIKEGTIKIYSDDLLKALVLNVEIDDEETMSIAKAEVQDYEKTNVISEEAQKIFVEEYGEITLPSNAEKIEYIDNRIMFYIGENSCKIKLYDENADESDYLKNSSDITYEKKTSTVNGKEVKYYICSDENFIMTVWKSNNKTFTFSTFGFDETEYNNILKEIV